MKELDLGNSDFKSIIENDNYFVDKSLFIKEIIKSQKQIILLPRPRRFGKTLNLSMLRYFFEINKPEYQKLFLELKIWQTENEIKQKQGKYPVIYLSFKDAKQNTWTDTLKHIKIEIANAFKNHYYLMNSSILLESEKNDFGKIVNRTADNIDFEVSLKQLSDYLYRFYKQKTIILIDEYDTPIQAGYKLFYDEAISFMRNLLSGAFKDNASLYKGVITGILRVSKESIFTGLNNVSVFTILDEEFSDKFGFTETETKKILTDFEVTTNYEQIRKWYNGYKIGNTTDIYNPWSILNYAIAHKKGFRPYWVNTSSDDLIKEAIKDKNAIYAREQLQFLISKIPIEKTIHENFVFQDIDKKPDLIWTLLTFSGYLTIDRNTGINRYLLKIPNFEIKYVFQNIIMDWLEADVKIQQNLLIKTANYLVNNEVDKFESGFKKIIGDTFSYFDLKNEHENVYQAYVLGLLAIIGDDYIIKSNRESGEGRYDIMLIPYDKTKFGVVIEIKRLQINNDIPAEQFYNIINNKISEAKNQIERNKYYSELTEHKIENIIKLPIVFVGKEPFITIKENNQ